MSEFVDYLSEVFREFGAIRSKRMFGGHGVYHDDLMIGLVADDELYLKVDNVTQKRFEQAESSAFTFFMKDGTTAKMSYYSAPETIYDDPETAKYWASLAYAAAKRTSMKKPTKKKSR